MKIDCAVTSLTISSNAAATTYTHNQGQLVTAAFTVIQTQVCNYPYTYTQTFTKNGFAITPPAWITFDATQKFTMIITNPVDLGVYVVTSTATIL